MAKPTMKICIAMLEDDGAEALVTASMIKRYFEDSPSDYLLDRFSSPQEFLAAPPLERYDVLFLDILLEVKMTGMDVAKEIRARNSRVGIVFLTKSTHFALDGYQVDAIDYIVKPLVYEEFYLKMRKIMDVVVHSIDKDLLLKTAEGVVKAKESDIVYIEVIKHYLYYHCRDGKVLVVRGAIKDCAKELSAKFARSGNSFLVNLPHVERVGGSDVYLAFDDGKIEAVPITRSYRDDFLNAFSDYYGD